MDLAPAVPPPSFTCSTPLPGRCCAPGCELAHQHTAALPGTWTQLSADVGDPRAGCGWDQTWDLGWDASLGLKAVPRRDGAQVCIIEASWGVEPAGQQAGRQLSEGHLGVAGSPLCPASGSSQELSHPVFWAPLMKTLQEVSWGIHAPGEARRRVPGSQCGYNTPCWAHVARPSEQLAVWELQLASGQGTSVHVGLAPTLPHPTPPSGTVTTRLLGNSPSPRPVPGSRAAF